MLKVILLGGLCWFITGFIFFSALFPRNKKNGFQDYLVLSFGLSIIITIFVGFILVVSSRLSHTNVILTLLILNLLAVGPAVLRFRSNGNHYINLKVLNWKNLIDPALLLFTVILVMLPRINFTGISPYVNLSPEAWSYMVDSIGIVNGSKFPQSVTQWSLTTAFPPDKVSFQIFTAIFLIATQLNPYIAIQIITLMITLISTIVFWIFSRQILNPFLATLVTLVLFFDSQLGIGRFTNRYGFTFYRAESFALMLGFITLWLYHQAILKDRRVFLILLPFFLASIATSHAVTAIIIGLMMIAIYCAKLFVNLNINWKEIVLLSIVAITTAILIISIFWITNNPPLYFNQVADTNIHGSNGELDPTYELHARLDLGTFEQREKQLKTSNRFYISPIDLWNNLVERSFPACCKSGQLAIIFLVISAIASLMTRNKIRKLYGIAFFVQFLFILFMGFTFSFLFETYIPAMHPIRREFPMASLFIIILGALIFQWLLDLTNEYRYQRYIFVISQVVLGLVVILYFLIPGMQPFIREFPRGDINENGIRALHWLSMNSNAEDLILSNIRTNGSFKMYANRTSLTEGRGAYGNPSILQHALKVIDQTARFYQNPLLAINVLNEYEVDFVIVASPNTIGGNTDLASSIDFKQLEVAPYLKQVARFGEVIIYKVDSPAPTLSELSLNGYLYLAKEQYTAAMQVFESAIAFNPLDAWAYAGLARGLEQQGETQLAIDNYEKAIKLADGYQGLYLELAKLYASQGDNYSALSWVKKAVQLEPDQVTYMALGDAYGEVMNFSEAEAQYQKALELDPESLIPQKKLFELYGDRLLSEGNTRQSALAYQAGISLKQIKTITDEDTEEKYRNSLRGYGYDFTSDFVTTWNFVDNIETEDQVDALGNITEKTVFVIDDKPQSVLFQHPPSSVSYSIEMPQDSKMRFALALSPEVWHLGKGDGVQYDIYINDGETTWHLFSEYVDPKNIISNRKWLDREVNLNPWAGETVTFTFMTGPGPNNDTRYDWAGWGEPRIVQPVVYNFIDQFPTTQTKNLQFGEVYTDTLTINYEQRNIIFQHPTSRLLYSLDLPMQSSLSFGFGMSPEIWSANKGDGMEFNVYLSRQDEPNKLYWIFQKYIDPKNNPNDQRWFDENLDLSEFGGQQVEIIFETRAGPNGNADFDWGGWSWPVLVGELQPQGSYLKHCHTH